MIGDMTDHNNTEGLIPDPRLVHWLIDWMVFNANFSMIFLIHGLDVKLHDFQRRNLYL